MLGKVPGNIEAIRPMKDGVIADFTVTEQMLKQFIKMVHARILAEPAHHHLRALRLDPGRAPRDPRIGARRRRSQVYLIEEPMAAAIGAGLPVSEATGSMVVDIGGGTTEVGVISLGGMVYKGSVRVGGDKFDEAIINYIRRNYGMLIGEPTAERSRRTSARPSPAPRSRRWKSRAATWPKACRAASRSPQRNPRSADRSAQPDRRRRGEERARADAARTRRRHRRARHVLTGGGALLRDLDRLLMEETGLPVLVAEDPLTCVAAADGSSNSPRNMGRAFSDWSNASDQVHPWSRFVTPTHPVEPRDCCFGACFIPCWPSGS
jgi:rod shape-determining protein MreB